MVFPTEWLRFAVPLAALVGAGALLLAVRSVGRDVAPRWAALRAQPAWLRISLLVVLGCIALRLARAGWRPLLVFVAILVVVAVWGEVALRMRR